MTDFERDVFQSIHDNNNGFEKSQRKFAGCAQKYDTWLPAIKAKLRVDADAIGDQIAQFYYVYLNLESSVQAMVLPQAK